MWSEGEKEGRKQRMGEEEEREERTEVTGGHKSLMACGSILMVWKREALLSPFLEHRIVWRSLMCQRLLDP